MNTQTQLNKELLNYTIEHLEDYKGADIYASDLHNEIFNTDYYIYGRFQAAEWLAALDGGVFAAMDEIEESFQNMLPYSYGPELKVKTKILKAPEDMDIVHLQNGTLNPKD